MQEKEDMKIVIVGHVDHGKSTLIGRLFFDTDSLPQGVMDEVERVCKELGRPVEFAYLLDQFEEERQQNVTIDTTQMFFKTDKRNYVIIDAPGHVEFVKNMITGASQAEAALLIVDANEGVQEQTKRHAYVLGLLGLSQVIVILNKMDMINFDKKRFDAVKSDAFKFLRKINIKPSCVIPISAKEGDNVARKSEKMPWYDGPTILEALDRFSQSEIKTDRPLRYPVQDVYKVGNDRLLVGRVESGVMKPGTEVTFLPSGKKTRVKSILVFGGAKEKAEPGESIGITIEHPLFIERGEVACSGTLPKTDNEIKANVFWLSKEPFKMGDSLLFRCSTQEIECTIEGIDKKLDSSTLEPIEGNTACLNDMEIGEVKIRLKVPVVVENFNDISELGRFVLTKGLDVSAGGIITN